MTDRQKALELAKKGELDHRNLFCAEIPVICREFRRAEAELTAARERLNNDSPGTPLGRLRGLSEYAVEHCGHNPIAAKPAELAIIEALETAREELGTAKRLLVEQLKQITGRNSQNHLLQLGIADVQRGAGNSTERA